MAFDALHVIATSTDRIALRSMPCTHMFVTSFIFSDCCSCLLIVFHVKKVQLVQMREISRKKTASSDWIFFRHTENYFLFHTDRVV